jgi:hypothetical protein
MVYFLFNISEETKRAKELFRLYGSDIQNDLRLSCLLKEYTSVIEDSWRLMKRLGVVDICSECAGKKTGGCCHFGIETCYSHIILLMNLLTGVKIPENRRFENVCLFIGEHGCQLKARFKTCIYHLCPLIKGHLSEYDLTMLRVTADNEIKLGVHAESVIREWIDEREGKINVSGI